MKEAVYFANAFIQTIVFTFLFFELLKPHKSFAFMTICWFAVLSLIRTLIITGVLNEKYSVLLKELPPILLVLFAFEDKLRQKITAYLMMWIVGLAAELTGYLVMWQVFSIDKDYALSMDGQEPIGVWAGRLLVCSMMLVTSIIIIMIRNRKKLKAERLSSRLLLILACTTAHSVYLTLFYYFNSDTIDQTDNLVQVLFQALLYTVIFFQYYSTKRMSAIAAREEALNASEAEKENEMRYIELADSKLRDINALREDLSRQLIKVRKLIKDREQRQKAEAIMDEMSERLSEIKAVNFCDDHTLNAVLTIKLNEPKVRDIRISILLRDCARSGADSYDMCSIVSNMLDNAIESCLREPNPSKTFIEIRSGIKGGFFVIRVANTCTLPFSPRTTKGEGHGYGIKIIDELCRKNNGEFTAEQRGSEVISCAFLRVDEI